MSAWSGFGDYVEKLGAPMTGQGDAANFEQMLERALAAEAAAPTNAAAPPNEAAPPTTTTRACCGTVSHTLPAACPAPSPHCAENRVRPQFQLLQTETSGSQ